MRNPEIQESWETFLGTKILVNFIKLPNIDKVFTLSVKLNHWMENHKFYESIYIYTF